MSLRKSSSSRNGSKSEVLPSPNARRKCTPAPSRVGLDLISFLTGRIDIPAVYRSYSWRASRLCVKTFLSAFISGSISSCAVSTASHIAFFNASIPSPVGRIDIPAVYRSYSWRASRLCVKTFLSAFISVQRRLNFFLRRLNRIPHSLFQRLDPLTRDAGNLHERQSALLRGLLQSLNPRRILSRIDLRPHHNHRLLSHRFRKALQLPHHDLEIRHRIAPRP